MKIRVDAPSDELRRERVEHATFARLDAIRGALEVPATDARRDRVERGVFDQLSAIRGLERAEAIAPLATRRRWVPYAAFVGAAAIVAIVVMSRGDREPPAREPMITQHVVPPGGGPTRWVSADAVVDAFSDTSVAERIDDQGVTLTLARGKVDCDVEPRPGRAPFRVVAGDITVSVVGTRFAVQRTTSGVRVDVTRGKVRVTTATSESYVTAGETWSSEQPITAAAPPPSIDPAQIDLEPQVDLEPHDTAAPKRPEPKPISPKDAFDLATKLEQSDLAASARMYRKAADGRDPTYGALALYSLAELERRRGAATTALRLIDEYLRRFPRGTNVEELLWIRIDIHLSAKQTAEMNAAAKDYLLRFPSGTYAKKARNLAGD